jgi:aminopeptidase-like protein
MNGKKIYEWIREIFYYHRSITGEGLRKTLNFIKSKNNKLKIISYKSGLKVFDWTIPKEWTINDAWIKDSAGKKILDYKKSNLHVVGYSIAINKKIKFKFLKKNLFSIKNFKNAIPYITSYYKNSWGFCLSEQQKKKFNNKEFYHAYIDSKHINGALQLGEIFIKGRSKKEIFFSSNICHPSMANNELSGPMISLALSKFVDSIKNRKFSYRFVFLPETIGSVAYINTKLDVLKKNMSAGFVLTCLGNNKPFSYLKSRQENSFADIFILSQLRKTNKKFKIYNFNERGSDERQYCYPGVDLPVCSLMRLKYREYKQYHTSLDNLKFISPEGLNTSYNFIKNCIIELEKNYKKIRKNYIPKNLSICEPKLSKYKLYPELSKIYGISKKPSKELVDILAYVDGKNDIFQISQITGLKYDDVLHYIYILKKHNLIS